MDEIFQHTGDEEEGLSLKMEEVTLQVRKGKVVPERYASRKSQNQEGQK